MPLGDNNHTPAPRRRWILWAAGVVLAVVLLASFASRDDVVIVRTGTVQRGTVRSVVSTNGKVEPVVNFEAHAPIGTTVKKLLVKEGDHVKKGQLLVQLDDADARTQAAHALAQVRGAESDVSGVQSGGTQEEVLTVESQLTKARADRDAAKRNLDALQRLQQNGAASPGEVKDAQDQLSRSAADVKLLEQKQKDRYSQPEIARVQAQKSEAQSAYAAASQVLGQLNIRAPFAGVVYSLPVRQGNYLNAGDLVLQEADLSKVLVRAFVDEPDIGRISAGDRIEVTWDGLPGRTWAGAVNTIPATLKLRGTRNVGETSCVVDNQDLKLLPNVNVNVNIVTAEHPNVLMVPREALRQDDGKSFVYQLADDKLQRRDVQVSIANLTQVEVTGGIAEGASVVLGSTNSKPLRNGVAAKPTH